MNGFLHSCGFALLLGGVLLILINGLLTPSYMASFKKGEVAARSSGIYLVRISAALANVLVLIYGCIGLYLSQQNASGLFGTIAFGVAFLGTVLLFAIEWSNLFVLRAVAQSHPETLVVLDKSRLVTIGFASGAAIFMLGWLLLAVNTWQVNVFPRWTSLSAIAGLILIPVLGATPLRIAGQVIGNVVFDLGLIGFGYSLIQIA
jgi:hypothetical protein